MKNTKLFAGAALVLVLVAGGLLWSQDQASNTTSNKLLLKADGLGEVGFGLTPEEAISILTPILGSSPKGDSGWKPSYYTGACPGNATRVVEWDGLRLLFSNAESSQVPGFFSYQYGNYPGGMIQDTIAEISTTEGATYGQTKTELESIYPEISIGQSLIGAGVVVEGREDVVLVERGWIEKPNLYKRLHVYLKDGEVAWFEAGWDCGE